MVIVIVAEILNFANLWRESHHFLGVQLFFQKSILRSNQNKNLILCELLKGLFANLLRAKMT